ncbi:hypothetical protein [Paraburkholderia sediminicola]|uniref:hypothetical protein n=1 Tax=Paraburkholderia sediminicola TaxID=458836 RepID=UPI0038B879D5
MNYVRFIADLYLGMLLTSRKRDAIGQEDVALVGLARWFGFAQLLAQMLIHLGTHCAFDEWLVEREHQVFDLGRRQCPFVLTKRIRSEAFF